MSTHAKRRKSGPDLGGTLVAFRPELCPQGKIAYTSRSDAKTALKRGRENMSVKRVYKHTGPDGCGYFHLTSMTYRQLKERGYFQ